VIFLFPRRAAGLAVLLCGACGGNTEKSLPAPSPSFAVIPKGTTHVFWKSVERGAREAGAELGVELQWKGPLVENDRAQQIQIVQQFVAQKVGGMQLSSPQITEKREMQAEGQTYIVGQGGAVRAGDTLTITLSGLPHRAAWPKIVAVLLAAIIIAAGAWGASRGGAAAPQSARRAQLNARRDKLFAELAALDAQRRKGAIEAGAYASRREALVTALEDLYAGLERETAA